MLAIDSPVEYDSSVTSMEFHTYRPYLTNSFGNNDEIRIPIVNQNLMTLLHESTLHVSGSLKGTTATTAAGEVHFVNNAIPFLFEDVRLEINGVEIDRTKDVGITSTIKSLLSVRKEEETSLKSACWLGAGQTLRSDGDFNFSIPLKMLLGVAEDYRRILVNVKTELVLLRSSTDLNAIVVPDTASTTTGATLTISSISWRVPHVTVNDSLKLKLYRSIEKDSKIDLAFRSWEIHEMPNLSGVKQTSWTVKTASQVQKPRYVIIALQTGRKGQLKKNMSQFDHCSMTDVKLYLNEKYYPYDSVRGDYTILYDMYSRFQKSYYQHEYPSCTLDFDTFKSNGTLFVIDCSKQVDNVKSGPVDVRIELQASANFPDGTAAYCLILHDTHFSYQLLTGTVRKVM